VIHREYEAYVYDLDGTLVHLDVDWAAVRDDVAAALRTRGLDVDGVNLWGLLELGDETGYRDIVEEHVSEYERDGARSSQRLAPADRLPHDVPVGVCSLNSEAACRIALEIHGLDDAVGPVVGRDSHEAEKPHPGPLLSVVEQLGVSPGETLFVGDTERDAETAREAGTAFAWAEEWAPEE
jgi:HAD superfamily hydrolase (TIGR01549 family)